MDSLAKRAVFLKWSSKGIGLLVLRARSYSIPNVYDDTCFENRISQLLDFEFKSWDLGSIENNSIVTIKNTMELLESAPEMIRHMLVEVGGKS